MINATALKPSQCRTHSSQLRFRAPHQRIKQISALAEREKQKMQLSHSLAEPRPPGIALRRRSKTASGPRSFAIRWLSLKVASAPKTKMNQRTFLTLSLSAIRHDRRAGVDDQLPGIGKMKRWSGENPDKNDEHGSGKSPGAPEADRRIAGEDAKCIAYHAKEIPLLFLLL